MPQVSSVYLWPDRGMYDAKRTERCTKNKKKQQSTARHIHGVSLKEGKGQKVNTQDIKKTKQNILSHLIVKKTQQTSLGRLSECLSKSYSSLQSGKRQVDP